MISVKPVDEALAVALEEQLVREFQVVSSIYESVQAERIALAQGDGARLEAVMGLKEALLDEWAVLDDARRCLTQQIAALAGLPEPSASILQILTCFEKAPAARLARLRDGILAQMDAIRGLTQGNQTLAQSALERNQALQAFILDLLRPPASYGPSGGLTALDYAPPIGVDQQT